LGRSNGNGRSSIQPGAYADHNFTRLVDSNRGPRPVYSVVIQAEKVKETVRWRTCPINMYKDQTFHQKEELLVTTHELHRNTIVGERTLDLFVHPGKRPKYASYAQLLRNM
jgi:hypothetical protein